MEAAPGSHTYYLEWKPIEHHIHPEAMGLCAKVQPKNKKEQQIVVVTCANSNYKDFKDSQAGDSSFIDQSEKLSV